MTTAMRTTTLLPLLATLFLATSCGGTKDGSGGKAQDMTERIRAMEDSLFQHMAFDPRGAQALLDVYKAYAGAFPLDSMAPEYLFRAAGVAKSMGDPEASVFLYDRIIGDYTSWKRLPDTYYMKAFTIDSELGRKGEAQRAYQEVINLFPDHPFARDARLSIENLKYTDEELIERFRRMEEEAAEPAADRR